MVKQKNNERSNRVPHGRGEMAFATAVRAIADAKHTSIWYCAGKIGLTRRELLALMKNQKPITPDISKRTNELLTTCFAG